MTISPEIDAAILTARAFGNSVAEVSNEWSRMKEVVHMALPLSDDLRKEIVSRTKLRFWTVEATPHDGAQEGFTDDSQSVSIVFPKKQ